MKHPLESIPQSKRLGVFLALLSVFGITTFSFRFIGPAKPSIVNFQLAGTVDKATAIINAWDTQAKVQAGFSLGFDFLYIPVYSTLIALICLWGAGVLASKRWYTTGLVLAWGLWAAAIFDAIENFALTMLLFGTITVPYPQVAQICAVLKFGLIALGLIFTVVSLVAYLVNKAAKASKPTG